MARARSFWETLAGESQRRRRPRQASGPSSPALPLGLLLGLLLGLPLALSLEGCGLLLQPSLPTAEGSQDGGDARRDASADRDGSTGPDAGAGADSGAGRDAGSSTDAGSSRDAGEPLLDAGPPGPLCGEVAQGERCEGHVFRPIGVTNVTEVHGALSGVAALDVCREGEVATGIEAEIDGARFTGSVTAYRTRCSLLEVRCGPSGPELRMVPGSRQPVEVGGAPAYRGTLRGDPTTRREIDCPPGSVLSGFEGALGRRDGGSTFRVSRLSPRCTPLLFDISAMGRIQIRYGTPAGVSASIDGTALTAESTAFPTTDCPMDMVATFIRTRSGDVIDAYGLGCNPLAVSVTPGYPECVGF
jgi:hypothetical protein